MLQKLGRWSVAVDANRTASYYRLMDNGASHECGCPGCGNYSMVKGEHFPKSFKKLLESIGVDTDKDVSMRRVAPLDNGLSLYAGSFAVVGKIVDGEEEDRVGGTLLDIYDDIDAGAWVALRNWHTPPVPWPPHECVRIRFLMNLPWVGEDPEAPLDLSSCKGPADRYL